MFNSDNEIIEEFKYNDEDKLSYKRQNKYETLYKYDDEKRIVSIIEQSDGTTRSEIDFEYDDNKITSKSYRPNWKDSLCLVVVTDSFYTDGVIQKYISYCINPETSSMEKFEECVYSEDGKKRTTTNYKNEYKIEVYNDNNDLIFEGSYRDNELQSSTTVRYEYDKFGNVLLSVRKNYYPKSHIYHEIVVYNYQYNDGEQFDCRQEFPEIFGGILTNDVSHEDIDDNVNGTNYNNSSSPYYYNDNSNYSNSSPMQENSIDNSTSNYNSAPTPSRVKCGSCNAGWYICGCDGMATFGITSYHRCSNCGEEHMRGNHMCQCRQCGGTSWR